jgi:MFS family permease
MAERSTGVRTYYALLITETVSQIGSLVSTVCVALAVFRDTGQATPLALVTFFQTLPVLVIGGFAGALADRFDRRAIMLAANIGFTAASALLLVAFASGAFQLWMLYAVSFLSAIFAAFQRPAARASVTMLVPAAHRDRANALGQLTGPVTGIVAPTAGGLLYAVVGVTGAILVDIATFLVAIAVLLVVRIPRPPSSAEGRAFAAPIWRQAFDGFRYLGARPTLLGFCAFFALTAFLVGGALVVGTPYVFARCDSKPLVVGLVFSALHAGGMTGALTMSAWSGRVRSRIHIVFPASALCGLLLALAGTAQTPLAVAAAFFAFMFTIPVGNAAMTSILQAKIAPDLQGRVFAAIGQINGLLTPLAALFSGPLADRLFEPARRLPSWRAVGWAFGYGPGAGIGMMLAIAGALTFLVTLAAYAVPALRRLETTLPDHIAAEPDPSAG